MATFPRLCTLSKARVGQSDGAKDQEVRLDGRSKPEISKKQDREGKPDVMRGSVRRWGRVGEERRRCEVKRKKLGFFTSPFLRVTSNTKSDVFKSRTPCLPIFLNSDVYYNTFQYVNIYASSSPP